MDKFDYVTATIEEEKERLSNILLYLQDTNNIDEYTKYQERYNLVCKYLNAKERYLNIYNILMDYRNKLNDLNKIKYEYEVDNILLEDTLLNKFHEDTDNKYRNILYENIKKEKISDILYLMFTKESEYTPLIIKRNRLREKLNEKKYTNTIACMNEQSLQIEKEDNLQDEMLLLQNNIKIEEDRLKAVEDSILDEDILKLLYEFCIINTYNINRLDKNTLFKDNNTLKSIVEKK